METKKNHLSVERLVLFCDAVVAIAITLLALELKIEPEGHHLTYAHIAANWVKFAAFFLSFLNIAIFWKIHHEFFKYIVRLDDQLLWYNIGWLLFIVLLPFTTSLISSYFDDSTAMSLYCIDTFFITFFQNQIWDYVAKKPDFLNEELEPETNFRKRVSCNVAMLNALSAIAISFIHPLSAFVILLFRFPMILASAKVFKFKLNSVTVYN